MNRDELAFHAAIDARPTDRLPRLVFADWLDERGRHGEAAWYRLCGETGTRPTSETHMPGYWRDIESPFIDRTFRRTIAHSRIPELLFRNIGTLTDSSANQDLWRIGWTRGSIETNAAMAFATLEPDEQRQVEEEIRGYANEDKR